MPGRRRPALDADINETNRLGCSRPSRTCNSGDRDGDLSRRAIERAADHGFGYFRADRAVVLDKRSRDAEHLSLALIGVGDPAAFVNGG